MLLQHLHQMLLQHLLWLLGGVLQLLLDLQHAAVSPCTH
jgi:hypothetical protein